MFGWLRLMVVLSVGQTTHLSFGFDFRFQTFSMIVDLLGTAFMIADSFAITEASSHHNKLTVRKRTLYVDVWEL